MGIWQRIRRHLSGVRPLFNLQIEPAYAIKASVSNPYFQSLQRVAQEAGYLGAFVVFSDGSLETGARAALETRHAQLTLDTYPNPAAIEGRTVSNYADARADRRVPRATVVLDDDSELFVCVADGALRASGPAVEDHEATP